jgi:hypothetical protein
MQTRRMLLMASRTVPEITLTVNSLLGEPQFKGFFYWSSVHFCLEVELELVLEPVYFFI